MQQKLPLPYKVSPLIKLCRWSMLVAGLTYGFKRQSKLVVEEQEFRVRDSERKAKVAEQLGREKAIADAAELEGLERIFLADEKNQTQLNDE